MRFRQRQRTAQQSTYMLVALFVLLIIAMVVITNAALALAWVIGTGGTGWGHFPKYFFAVNTAVVLLYVLGSYGIESLTLSDGGAQLAIQAGGHEITEPQNIYEKRLCNVVMEVAVATGIRPPRVFVLGYEDSINAFAAGWDVQDSIVAVTRGTIERLTRDELQGVVAHEFSHILHGDMRLNMRLMSMVLGLQLLYNFGVAAVSTANETYGRARMHFTLFAFGVALMGVGWLGWFAGRILSASVSRQREFLADASAVKYTRYNKGLAGALRKIAYQSGSQREQLQNEKALSLAPMFLHFGSVSQWLATHPPIPERLKRLGEPYEDMELADDIQDISHDEFVVNRLLPASAMTPALKSVTRQWGSKVPYVGNVLNQTLPNAPLSALEWPDADKLKQFNAVQRLSGILPAERLSAALLAFWVPEGNIKQCQLWEQLCRDSRGHVPFMMLESVQDLAPDAREPMFERLVTQAEPWPKEERVQLSSAVLTLLKSNEHSAPREWLRLAVLRYWLRERKGHPQAAYQNLSQIKKAVAVLSLFMARCLEAPNPQAWVEQVFERLELPVSAAAVKVIDADNVRLAVLKLHRSALLVPPILVKGWLQQWETIAVNREPQALQRDADTFRMMCALLDTPRPPQLLTWHQTPALN